MVISRGKIFSRRMIETSCRAHYLHHWISLNSDFRSDLEWWIAFLPLWNARSMMEIHTPSWQPSITFASDASGNWGCGAACKNNWIQAQWGNCWLDHHIACKELLPIVIACAVWGVLTGNIRKSVTIWQWSTF